MKNKRTTIIGILLIIGAVAGSAAAVLSGDMTIGAAVTAVMAALGGGGFLASGDGGL